MQFRIPTRPLLLLALAGAACSIPWAETAYDPPPSEASQHTAVRDLQCGGCHLPSTGWVTEALPDWNGFTPEVAAPMDELCGRCHVPPEDSRAHGPADTLQCQICHEHHRSEFPFLLRSEQQAPLCTTCHRGSDAFPTEARHASVAGQDCVVCHDPHGGDNAALLRAGVTAASLPPSQD
jgi:predicted CXXCH cytochrome family protein